MEKLGDILLAKGFLDHRALSIAMIQQEVTRDTLGATLIKLGFVTPAELAQGLAEQWGLEYIAFNPDVITDEALKVIPQELVEKLGFIPLDIENGVLSIGVDQPYNVLAMDTVTKITGFAPKVYVVDTDSFLNALE